MFDPIVTILVFVAVIAITAILFGGWLVMVIVSALGRLLMAPLKRRPTPQPWIDAAPSTMTRCSNERCRAENAPVASFCRRCGAPMRAKQHLPVRRVAMW